MKGELSLYDQRFSDEIGAATHQVLCSGASTMIPESQLEPVGDLPDLEADKMSG